jgi:threonine/homoserine/homoserine lactone efflux protein
MLTLHFFVTALIIVLLPGTGVMFTVATGLRHGRRASLLASLGCTAGIIPHLLATVLGLAALLHMYALAFQLVKFAGAAYLVYLAWGMWRDTGSLALDTAPAASRPGGIVLKAFLINILNPKLSIFFLAFLPQFITPTGISPLFQMLWLGGTFMAMTLVVFIAYGLLANAFRTSVVLSPNFQPWIQRSCALTLAAIAFNLAYSER